jgi:hypothetical protein
MAERRVLIRASHIVAYQEGGHRYLRDGVIVNRGANDPPRRAALRWGR